LEYEIVRRYRYISEWSGTVLDDLQ